MVSKLFLCFTENFLFDDTIKNNITNQQEDRVNYEKLNKSLEMSHLNAFINDLDNGIDTIAVMMELICLVDKGRELQLLGFICFKTYITFR